ncbi:MAG: hypothetical protein ACXABY_01365 [Candidatus Thorarchaeota archaeon]|jgi:hypothetical protein
MGFIAHFLFLAFVGYCMVSVCRAANRLDRIAIATEAIAVELSKERKRKERIFGDKTLLHTQHGGAAVKAPYYSTSLEPED